MNEAVNESELGRSKKNHTPAEHLGHLLNIGWSASSLLVQKYVAKYGLQNELAQLQKNHKDQVSADLIKPPVTKHQ